jgi:putative polyketide hydroxylase
VGELPRDSVDVLVVGAGPIGLTAAALLDQQGISSFVVDRKRNFDEHPRARFLDSCTLELFRQLGVAQAVEATGIGPSWTEVITCAESLAGKQIARIPSPEFYSVPRAITPQIPVMTCQDLVEPILYERVQSCAGAEVRLASELTDLSQDTDGCRARVRDLETDREREISARFVIGADGVRSTVRSAIGAELEGEVRDTYFRDVLFHADLSPWIDDLGRKGALLFVAHPLGAGMFQPLDGKQRFRIQIAGLEPDAELDDDFCRRWLWSAVGAEEEFDIEIFTKRIWRVSARSSTRFAKGRIFLAGDAAQVFTPTGGMGMNASFAGIRNLCWKLAYVLRDLAPESILETYEGEWKPQSLRGSRAAIQNADYIMGVFGAYMFGGDLYKALHDVKQYTHYTGAIFGYEIASPLCRVDANEPPTAPDELLDYEPVVRSGRRLPHVWLDEEETRSILDPCGIEYVLFLGPDADTGAWTSAAERITSRGFPLSTLSLDRAQTRGTPLEGEEAILVRPDLIVVAHLRPDAPEDPATFLESTLPLRG